MRLLADPLIMTLTLDSETRLAWRGVACTVDSHGR